MPRAVAMAAVGLVVILGCLSVSIYALAHSGGDFQSVQDFLIPSAGCPAPCWQGIRPGITNSLEAVERLQAMPWVTGLYSIQGIVINDSFIRWQWSGKQPDIVDNRRDGRIWFHNGLVYSIEIPLLIPFGQVWGALGAPDFETTLKAPLTPPQVFYSAVYAGDTLVFKSTVLCPPNGLHVLAAQVDATITVAQPPTGVPPTNHRLGCDNGQR